MSGVNLVFGEVFLRVANVLVMNRGQTMLFQESHCAVRYCCSVSTCITQRGIETGL